MGDYYTRAEAFLLSQIDISLNQMGDYYTRAEAFLLSQIDISLNQMGDYYTRAEAKIQDWDLSDYATNHEQGLLRDIQYHAEEIQKEITRNRDRNTFLRLALTHINTLSDTRSNPLSK
jgi:uncharacterized HAD superfamily protein